MKKEKLKNIEEKNKEIIKLFNDYLVNLGLAKKTIKNHIWNIEFFAEYLIRYEPHMELLEADAGNINDFLGNWFVEKAMWSSPSAVRAYISTFKKFFACLQNNNKISEIINEEVLEIIKEEKRNWIENAEF